jgi:hypothetical protein
MQLLRQLGLPRSSTPHLEDRRNNLLSRVQTWVLKLIARHRKASGLFRTMSDLPKVSAVMAPESVNVKSNERTQDGRQVSSDDGKANKTSEQDKNGKAVVAPKPKEDPKARIFISAPGSWGGSPSPMSPE